MSEYGVYEAKTKLADLIKKVERGEYVTITNRGKPVVDIVPSASLAAQKITEAIAAIKAQRMGNPIGNINQAQFNEMRFQGRR